MIRLQNDIIIKTVVKGQECVERKKRDEVEALGCFESHRLVKEQDVGVL